MLKAAYAFFITLNNFKEILKVISNVFKIEYKTVCYIIYKDKHGYKNLKGALVYMQNKYYRKISAMVLTLMITASTAVAVNAELVVPADDTSSSIVSDASDSNDNNDNSDKE